MGRGLNPSTYFFMMKIEFIKSVKSMKKTALVGEIWDVPHDEAKLLISIKAAKPLFEEIPAIEETQSTDMKKGKRKK